MALGLKGRPGFQGCLDPSPAESSCAKAESSQHFAPAKVGDVERPAVEIWDHPFSFQSDPEYRCTEGSADVGPTLGPVETGKREPAAQLPCSLNVNSDHLQGNCPLRGEFKAVVGPPRACGQPAQRQQAIAQGHAQRPCDVVVTSPCLADWALDCGYELRRAPGKHSQPFKRTGHSRPFEAVVVMPALANDRDQMLCPEPVQMNTGGRGTYLSNHRELGAGSRLASHQEGQHARTCRLADSRRDPRDCLRSRPYIHHVIINEALMRKEVHIFGATRVLSGMCVMSETWRRRTLAPDASGKKAAGLSLGSQRSPTYRERCV